MTSAFAPADPDPVQIIFDPHVSAALISIVLALVCLFLAIAIDAGRKR